eukprot:CAMPEP_0115149526 /NCGR_PEP_ID=MMETSP0227-20121206/64503_1 /TAXON_ID=89957 /ORGANISM="Polarella glacialis, Strain CCMP 1383" /LENGTH=64 /DNA_ID=CAMNT_0002559731 /DNA_START=59 /DNA_END=250 /DNA_ORIENTATION=-
MAWGLQMAADYAHRAPSGNPGRSPHVVGQLLHLAYLWGELDTGGRAAEVLPVVALERGRHWTMD